MRLVRHRLPDLKSDAEQQALEREELVTSLQQWKDIVKALSEALHATESAAARSSRLTARSWKRKVRRRKGELVEAKSQMVTVWTALKRLEASAGPEVQAERIRRSRRRL
jgi:hypothetical protein